MSTERFHAASCSPLHVNHWFTWRRHASAKPADRAGVGIRANAECRVPGGQEALGLQTKATATSLGPPFGRMIRCVSTG